MRIRGTHLLLAATLIAAASCALTVEERPAFGVEKAVPSFHGQERSSMDEACSTARRAIESKLDVLGEEAMRQPNGPSYEFFAKLLPPLRYVDAPFFHYPIVLSAPSATVKARFISNGSSVNALARQLNWKSETGNPVTFYLGEYGSVFGGDLHYLEGPHYENDYLPIVRTRYRHGDAEVTEEALAGIDYAENGVVFLRFTGKGKVIAQLSLSADAPLPTANGVVRDPQGGALLWFDENWKWAPGAQRLVTILSPDRPVLLAVPTKPVPSELPKLDASIYDAQRSKCIRTWQSLLDRGMQVETPEPVVNNAWRSLIIGTFELIKDNDVNYSAGNQYAKMYVGEGGDAVRALALWGHKDDARRLLVPLMDYKRDDLLFHQAGKKLQLLSDYYWLTHDAGWFTEQRNRLAVQVNRLVNEREPGTGLAPRESYCGDIHTQVYSLNSNANGWSGLHHFSAVLEDMGDHTEAQRLADSAKEWRPRLWDAFEKSVRKDVNPPFVPMALFGEEQPYDPLTATRLGGYWDLVAPYVLACGFFPYDSQEAHWITDYLEQKGGLMMGMVRTHPESDFWAVTQNIDDLYTLRYVLVLLQRDEVDRALVSFYGKLAQGLTRDTFIGAEGTCPMPIDQLGSSAIASATAGRQMYLPPNSASNAFFLAMLRYVLVQDWDMDGDGRPDTLRLMFATPRRWLEDGKSIKVEKAPTAFGELSVSMTSHLEKGYVLAEVTAPPRSPDHFLLRARLPEGWKVVSAEIAGKNLPVDAQGTVDVTGLQGKLTVRFTAKAQRPPG